MSSSSTLRRPAKTNVSVKKKTRGTGATRSPAAAVKSVVRAALVGGRGALEVAIEAQMHRPDGSMVLLDTFRSLKDDGHNRRAKQFVELTSSLANSVKEIPGHPEFQALGFAIPMICVSGSVGSYARGDLTALRQDVTALFQRQAGLPESVVIAMDPHLYRDAEFRAIGPVEARAYFESAAAAVLDAQEIEPLPTNEEFRGALSGCGSKPTLDHAAYVLVGTVILPSRPDVTVLSAIQRLRALLRQDERGMGKIIEFITQAIEEVLPGCQSVLHIADEDRLDMTGERMSSEYTRMEQWQARGAR